MNRPRTAWLGIRSHIPRIPAILLGLIPLAALLAFWWWATKGAIVEERYISPVILPSPSEVLASWALLWERDLSGSAAASLWRVLMGFLVAAVIAVPLGILMGSFGLFRAMFSPVSVIGGYLPIAALVPLTLSWFGIGELQKTIFLAIASFVYLLPLVVRAVDSVDHVYLQTAYTLGASRLQTVFKVLIPVAMADIYDAMRLVFGIGWTYIILAEVVAAERGLGFLIIASQRRGPREHIYLVLFVIIILAFITDMLLVLGGKALFPYRNTKR